MSPWGRHRGNLDPEGKGKRNQIPAAGVRKNREGVKKKRARSPLSRGGKT